MASSDRYETEAAAPSEPSLHEVFRYSWDETARRWYNATNGLTAEDYSHDPGEGAWSMGEIMKHMFMLQGMIIEQLEPGTGRAVPRPDIGEPGAWNVENMLAYREALNDCFRDVWARTTPETLMELRPGMPPDKWADWPVSMRIMRPFIDIATHVGQIAYARRQLGKPVART